ncbi:PD-(D/E)XK motif protein [Pseudarthrobacter sp. PS3-L1]|uniref:PD-(D/E)XK motif protein n=1 Tax=Pseudarthrobacter sp. PS3-L1 TaxID=3046207 RepID=UPI0024BBBA7E|nr:PD-(D/E)XK motif protein [Pseudarthrobacter sp. PS3-L1]MDJ0319513.1 PD-(D/E)XK motif protein [Pseudarthrobacter sp. PS3-L1]
MTEPIIELTIKRLELSQSALFGLAGELLILDAVFRQADEQYVGQLVQAWDGWRRSSRDFSWDGTGVEIKTTTGSTSRHTVEGVHQIEPLQPSDDVSGEDRLLLVSVGLQLSAPSANSFTVPQLTQRIVERMEATGNGGAAADFLAHVSSYGSESGFGYHHTTMSNDAPFTTSFTPAFVRCYEMGDPAVEVLRRDDVVSHHHVDAQSVTFTINLPATISADNPVSGIHRVSLAILGGEPQVP